MSAICVRRSDSPQKRDSIFDILSVLKHKENEYK